jgi:cell division initiation protein
MTITPQDIQAKQFHVRMRGFDMDEVDKFLEKVAEELLISSLENKQLLEKVETMAKELANYKNKEQAFQSAILSAQRISDEMQARSRREADEIVLTAKRTTEELESRIQREVDTLVAQSRQEAADLIAGAANEARQTLADARQEQSDLTNNINRLIEMKDRIMYDLRLLLNNYLDHIDSAVPTGLNVLEPLPRPEETGPARAEGAAAPPPESGAAPAGRIEDIDLEDLYEKIELAEPVAEPLLDDLELPTTLDLTDIEPLDEDVEEQTPTISLAALDNDEEEELFPLEDPLDELEPSFSINEDDKTG